MLLTTAELQKLASIPKILWYFLKSITLSRNLESEVTSKPNELEDRPLLAKKPLSHCTKFFWRTPNSNLDYMSSAGCHNQERMAK